LAVAGAMSVRVLCVNLGSRTAKLTMLAVDGAAVAGSPAEPLHDDEVAIETFDESPRIHGVEQADIVAYRVVRIAPLPAQEAVAFDASTTEAVARADELDPLHTRTILAVRRALRRAAPRARHVAVFDSAFHRTIPARAATYGLPYDDFVAGWRKIGFHGLSHAYAAARTATLLGDAAPCRKLVSAHLGGGASLAAVDGARSIDTTMGYTPLDGLLMATRSGSIDPGLLLAYMRRHELGIDAAETLLNERSGLLGLGGSADLRAIIAEMEHGDDRARLAYDAFVYRVSGAIGAMSAALGGLEAIAFLGGIGENAAGVRRDACLPFGFAGVRIDPERNDRATGDAIVSSSDSTVFVLRIHTREDWMMALAAFAATR
jgi:acetate kinase